MLAIAAGVALAIGVLTAPSGDAPSHLFQTWLYRHGGFEVWNNYWYAGRYEFVNYSVLYYALAAQVGQLGVLVPASGVLGAGFAAVCRREWGDAARGPSLAFAATAPFIMMVAGVYPFLAGRPPDCSLWRSSSAAGCCCSGRRCSRRWPSHRSPSRCSARCWPARCSGTASRGSRSAAIAWRWRWCWWCS